MSERIVQQPVATQRQEKFQNLPTAEVERSTFDMSHPWKGTQDTNKLVPVLTMEVLPGDTFNVKTTAFSRLATPLKPLMDSVTADIHYFFVPNRIIWGQWETLMGEVNDPDDPQPVQPVPQVITGRNVDEYGGSILDYMGIPLTEPGDTNLIQVNALPWRAYWQIYNDWYRNQNLQAKAQFFTDSQDQDISSSETLYMPSIRNKRGDYFTKALPWPQKGDPVYLPLGTEAPVVATNLGLNFGPSFTVNDEVTNLGIEPGGDQASADWVPTPDDPTPTVATWADPRLEADLTEATAATINDIRTAFQIQRLLERDARSGTRYIEILLAHFNVQSPDFRLQRAEFLGMGSARLNISPVAATVATEEAPQGNLSAVGTGVVKAGFTHSFTEHGYLIGIMSCRADLTYQNGLDRMWSRRTRYDFYWPALSHLGEQAILNKEIYMANTVDDEETWGFQERYAEYRYQPGRITGKFRSVDPESLDVWHLAQSFEAGLPPLSGLFLRDLPPIDRVVAVPSEPDLITDIWHEIQATRPMPVYAVPGLVDHF